MNHAAICYIRFCLTHVCRSMLCKYLITNMYSVIFITAMSIQSWLCTSLVVCLEVKAKSAQGKISNSESMYELSKLFTAQYFASWMANRCFALRIHTIVMHLQARHLGNQQV